MKLKTKFILLIAILVAIFTLTAFFAFSDYKQSIKETISQQQFVMISTLADDIDSKLLTAQQDLIAFAKTAQPDIMQNTEKAQAFLDMIPILHTVFDYNVVLFTPSGKIFAESPYMAGRRGIDLSSREFIINTLKTNKSYISDPYLSTKPPQHPVVMLTVPVFDSKGKITGILGGSIDLMGDNFIGRLSTVKIGATGYLILTAVDRTLIMHPDKKRILTKQVSGGDMLYDRAIEGFEGTGENITSYGTKMLSSYKRLKAKNWILIASYPQAEAYRPIQVAEQYLLIVGVTGIIAVFFSMFIIIKYFIKPLELFTRHIEDIPQKIGDDRFLNIKTKDEIETLSRAFNKMVTEIDKRTALERSEELYRTVTEFATDFVYWSTPDNKIMYASENCERFCGYTEREFYASPELLETIIHPDDRSIWAEHEHHIQNKDTCENLELRMITKSGAIRWIAHNCLPVYDKKGNYRGRRGSHHDVTERKRMEDSLRKSEKSLKDITSSLAEGIYVTDENVRITFWNETAKNILGWSFEELSDKNIHDVIHFQRGDGARLLFKECHIYNVLSTGKQYYSNDEFFTRKDGLIFSASVLASPILEGGRIVGVVTAFRDITERKRLEQEAIKAQKLESIGILAGGIAHDFNNLMQAVIIGIDVAKQYASKDDKTCEILSKVENICDTAKELSYRLLTFSTGGEPLKRMTSMPILLRESAALALRGSNIICEFSFPDNLYPAEVDEGQIKQVILNLLINAKDAMPDKGLVRISAENVALQKSNSFSLSAGQYLKISVSDQGKGIPQEYLSKIFDPYFSTKGMGNQKGTGLGLTICHSIITKHGGTITVASSKGDGTTFQIYLPATEGRIIKDKRVSRGSGRIDLP